MMVDFARPRRAHEGDKLSRPNVHVHVVEDQGPVGLVAKGDVADLDVAAQFADLGLVQVDLGWRLDDQSWPAPEAESARRRSRPSN